MKQDAPSGKRSGVEGAYSGDTARGYLARRQASLKWRLEQQTVESLLSALPAGSTVLDAPVGTGRFLAAFARHAHRFVGVDISRDMLLQADAESGRSSAAAGRLVQATVGSLPLADGSVDYVLSLRLLNWFDIDTVRRTLGEFRRVCRHQMVVGVRLAAPLGRRRLPRFAAELLRRPASSLRRLLSRRANQPEPRLTNHPEVAFFALLEELHLRVERALPIDDGTACTRELFRHTPLMIFVLSPDDARLGS